MEPRTQVFIPDLKTDFPVLGMLWTEIYPPKSHIWPKSNPYNYTVEVTNQLKGLDLINIVHEELRTEVHDIVEETVIKTIPMRKKCKEAKWLPVEDLKKAEKRRDAKGKGENERYMQSSKW